MKSYLLIIRPVNCLFIAFAVLVGSTLSRISIIDTRFIEILITVLSAVLIAAGGYVINDYYDLPVDRVNKPKRVLPSGRMTSEKAYFYSMILFTLGIVLSFFTAKIEIIAIAIVNSFLLYFYAKLLKNSVLAGNILVAWTTASTLLYGALMTENTAAILPLFIYTFLYTISREIIKDAEDVEGDRIFGVRTLASLIGSKGSLIVSTIPVILLTFLLYGNFRYLAMPDKLFYTLIVMFVVPLLMIYVVVFHKTEAKKIKTASALTKAHMLILLITYVWLS